MVSKWASVKESAVRMRKDGRSYKYIRRELGIPLSTLSGWLKDIELNESQLLQLRQQREAGWEKSRIYAAQWHRDQKRQRLMTARVEAEAVMSQIELTPQILDLAAAMLYLGEGAKQDGTSLASSDPLILRFFLAFLKRNYHLDPGSFRYQLHLRMDQDEEEIKAYWASELRVPLDRFVYANFDKRTEGRPTYDRYKGVCVVNCGHVVIQRKLMYLYSLFCERIAELEMGT